MSIECLAYLSTLIDTMERAEDSHLPARAAVDELVSRGDVDALLLLLAGQELRGFYQRVLRWRACGRAQPPLTDDEIGLLRDRTLGISACASISLPSYLAETYRDFSLWYWRMLHCHAGADFNDPPS